MNEYTYDVLAASGASREEFTVMVTADMMAQFLSLTGDCNPLHIDADYARGQGFRDRVVYGMLASSLCSTLVGVYLPGRYALLQQVDSQFHKPVYIGDVLTVGGTVIEKHDTFKRLTIRAEIRNQHGEKVNKAKIVAGCLK